MRTIIIANPFKVLVVPVVMNTIRENRENMWIEKGDVLNEKNLRIVRPGFGLAPKYYDIILGRRVTRDVNKGTATNWNLIK